MAFWWLLDIGVEPKLLTWEEIVDKGLSPQDYPHPALLRRRDLPADRALRRATSMTALERYLKAGGCLAALPSLPWPFYRDENGQP